MLDEATLTGREPGVLMTARASGDAAVVVEASGGDEDARWRAVHGLRLGLLESGFPGFVDLVSSFEHVLVQFDPAVTDAAEVLSALRDRAADAGVRHPPAPRVFIVPVVFGGGHGPDLDALARAHGLSPGELVDRATSVDFTVRFLGTAMQPMCAGSVVSDPVARQRTPRTRLPGGSIGLAAHTMTIYPFDSPGGWQLIGRTPLTVVDLARDPAAPYDPGDILRLRAITPDEWHELAARPLEADATAQSGGRSPRTATTGRATGTVPNTARARATGATATSGHLRAGVHTGALRVSRPGYAQLQDLGRPGHERDGVGVNGAADQMAAQQANILVGNPRSAPLIEATLLDLELTAESDALVAVTGAPCEVSVDGVPRPRLTPLPLRAGQRIAITGIHDGTRVSLAIAGAVDAPTLMGSCAPDPVVGFSTRLAAGDLVRFTGDYRDHTDPLFGQPLFRFAVPRRNTPPVWSVPVTTATETDELVGGIGSITAKTFTVCAQSDAVGIRLEGEPITRTTSRELISRGIPVGGVELVPTGDLIVVMRGRYITAGYPVVAAVTRVGLSTLAQAEPGRRVRFELQSRADASADWRRQLAALDDLERRVTTAFRAAGVRPSL
ncbi:5-oxoprolinase/urea amidolyase family protein [Okibacterium endophyticum]